MGNWVTVEAFRQIRISGDLPPASKIGTILLAAPDIDIDVFKSQLRRFGKPQKPFYVVLSQDDRALFLSRTIAGGVTRVGDASDTAELTALGASSHRSERCQGDRRHEPRQIRPARFRRAPAARHPRAGHQAQSSGRRRERKGGERGRFSGCAAAYAARRAGEDHRRPVSRRGAPSSAFSARRALRAAINRRQSASSRAELRLSACRDRESPAAARASARARHTRRHRP